MQKHGRCMGINSGFKWPDWDAPPQLDGAGSQAARDPPLPLQQFAVWAAQRGGQGSNKCSEMEVHSHGNVVTNKPASVRGCWREERDALGGGTQGTMGDTFEESVKINRKCWVRPTSVSRSYTCNISWSLNAGLSDWFSNEQPFHSFTDGPNREAKEQRGAQTKPTDLPENMAGTTSHPIGGLWHLCFITVWVNVSTAWRWSAGHKLMEKPWCDWWTLPRLQFRSPHQSHLDGRCSQTYTPLQSYKLLAASFKVETNRFLPCDEHLSGDNFLFFGGSFKDHLNSKYSS